MSTRTVFLHCGWRTASTYLWSRFRALDQTVAYYEPLHEFLARMTPDGSDPNASWNSVKRSHPGEDKPFAEFVPLTRDGAVAGYHPRFATQDFFLSASSDDPDLQSYIALLETHAADRNKHAVYGFCRSLGRVAWLRRRFPGAYNIVLTRSPYDHWRSCLSQFTQHKVPYFLMMPIKIVAENQDRVPEFRNLARQYSIPDPRRAPSPASIRVMVQLLPPGALLHVFIEVYSLAYAHALSHADLVLDIDSFADGGDYRDGIIARIESETGLVITPGDINLTRYTPDKDDPFAQIDLRRISTLSASSGPVTRSGDAVARFSRALKADIARVRTGGR